MTTVAVRIPTALRRFSDEHATVRVEIAATPPTLSGVLDALAVTCPGVVDRVLDEQGRIRRHVNVFVGPDDVRVLGGLDATVDDGAEVSIVPAVSGGAVDRSVDDLLDALERDGYAIVRGALDEPTLAAARGAIAELLPPTPTGRNAFEGYRTQRVYSVLAKTRALDPLVLHPLVLGACDRVLAHYQVSATVAIAIGPGEAAQLVHHDDAIYPLPSPHADVLVSTMWALDDFDAENGATVLYPGTHRATEAPEEDAVPIYAEMPAGSVAVYLGTLWHGGGANTTDRVRVGVTFEYLAGWLRQQENHALAVPPAVAAELPPRLQELLGYSVYPPFMGYVDGRDPKRLLGR